MEAEEHHLERRIQRHELACERRLGEIQSEIAVLKTAMERNTKLLYVVVAGLLAGWLKVLLGGGI